ncbi:conserved hypothetical protein [Pseudomonas sp. IT-P12]
MSKTLVGASLLAKAACHPIPGLDVPTPSRAGSLPHLISSTPNAPSPSSIILFSLYCHA